MTRFQILPFLFAAICCLSNCKKLQTQDQKDAIACQNMSHIKIKANSPVSIGETIDFNVFEAGDNVFYNWIGPDNLHEQFHSFSIGNASLKNEGWYYLSASNNACDTKFDSVYIDVQLQQGTPSCSVASNTTNYSLLASDSYSYVRKEIESTYSLMSLSGSGNGNLTVYFHPYWRTKEPEDGIYTTTNVPLFDQVDNDYNKLFISTVNSSIFWSCYENQQVYVSHVGGKLQVRFCNLNMGGYNGNSYSTTASGNIIEK